MTKYNLINSMIGEVYPFFLSNSNLEDSYYLYRIYSPKLSEDLIPYISLEKISEKTKNEPYGHGTDILSICLGSKKNIEVNSVKLLSELLKKESPEIKGNNLEFPLIKLENGNNIQKSIIIGLRDLLRWKIYKFQPGRFVDILWTPNQFIVFEIKGGDKEEDEIYLEPKGVYNNMDLNLEKPLDIDLNTIDYPKTKWSGKYKASEINRLLKKLEWESFNRSSF